VHLSRTVKVAASAGLAVQGLSDGLLVPHFEQFQHRAAVPELLSDNTNLYDHDPGNRRVSAAFGGADQAVVSHLRIGQLPRSLCVNGAKSGRILALAILLALRE